MLRGAEQKVIEKEKVKKDDFFKGAVFSSSFKMNSKYDGEEDEWDSPKFKVDEGLRLDFKNLTLFAGAGLPLKTFQELQALAESGAEEVRDECTARWGVQAQLPLPKASPVKIKGAAGTLGFTKGVSLLKSPQLSWGSALRKVSFADGRAGYSFPSVSSGKKEEAVFADAVFTDIPFCKAEFSGIKGSDGSFALSVLLPFCLSPGYELELCALTGEFVHGKQRTTSWFCKNLPYEEKEYNSSCAVLNIRTPFATSSSAAGLSENPFGAASAWGRSVFGLNLPSALGLTNARFGAFLADGPLVTASGAAPEAYKQLLLGLSHSFYVKGALLRIGAAGRRTWLEEGNDASDLFTKDNVRLDAEAEKGHSSFALSYLCDSEKGEETRTRSFKWGQDFAKARTGLTLSSKSTSKKDTYSVKAKIVPTFFPKGTSCSFDFGASFNVMEEILDSTKVNSSFTLNLKGKKLALNAKFAFSTEIQGSL